MTYVLHIISPCIFDSTQSNLTQLKTSIKTNEIDKKKQPNPTTKMYIYDRIKYTWTVIHLDCDIYKCCENNNSAVVYVIAKHTYKFSMELQLIIFIGKNKYITR